MTSQTTRSITAAICDLIESLLDRDKSRYTYDIGKNPGNDPASTYAVRPGTLDTVAGTTKSTWVDQSFEVEFAEQYVNAPGDDEQLQDLVLKLFDDFQTFWGEAHRSKFGVDGVQCVTNFSGDAPTIDTANKVASLTMRFTVKYRTEV